MVEQCFHCNTAAESSMFNNDNHESHPNMVNIGSNTIWATWTKGARLTYQVLEEQVDGVPLLHFPGYVGWIFSTLRGRWLVVHWGLWWWGLGGGLRLLLSLHSLGSFRLGRRSRWLLLGLCSLDTLQDQMINCRTLCEASSKDPEMIRYLKLL